MSATRLNGMTYLRCDAVVSETSWATCDSQYETLAGINGARRTAVKVLGWSSAAPPPRTRGIRDYCPDHREVTA